MYWVVGIVVLLFIIGRLNRPWNLFHAKHIAPIEKEILALDAEKIDNRSRFALARNSRDKAKREAMLWDRNFSAEIRKYVVLRNEAWEAMEPLNDAKANLHEEQDGIRNAIRDWHDRNGTFSQSDYSELEDLKDERSSTSEAISELKAASSEIYQNDYRPAKEAIKDAHEGRKRLRKYKESGIDKAHFLSQSAGFQAKMDRLDRACHNLEGRIAAKKSEIERQKLLYKFEWDLVLGRKRT